MKNRAHDPQAGPTDGSGSGSQPHLNRETFGFASFMMVMPHPDI
jgi:hypothetical protein